MDADGRRRQQCDDTAQLAGAARHDAPDHGHVARQQQREHSHHVDGAGAYRDRVVDEDPATADLGARQEGE
jgi:hypothetical protein